jgi:hypothetical protein
MGVKNIQRTIVVQQAVTALKDGRDREGWELIQQSVPVVEVIRNLFH